MTGRQRTGGRAAAWGTPHRAACRRALTAAALGACLWAAAWLLAGNLAAAALGPEALDEQVWRVPLAPGVDLVAVRRLDGDGWLDLFALRVDLSVPGVELATLTAPTLTRREPTSELARREGAIAAVNGDFFYLGAGDAPVGLVVKDGLLWKGPDPAGRPSLVVMQTAGGPVARIGSWKLVAQLVADDGSRIPVDGYNEPALRPGQVAAFDSRWGSAPLPATRQRPQELAYARLVSLREGSEPTAWEVRQSGQGATGPPGPGELVLLGWREGARRLLEAVGRVPRWRLEWRLEPLSDLGAAGSIRMAISGGGWLVRAGQVVSLPAPPERARAPGSPESLEPRTAAGVDSSGKVLWLAVADGRRPTSRGLTAEQLARWMVRLGAWEALYLDGGGSATLVADLAGEGPVVVNRPSSGAERPVPVAVGVHYRPPGRAAASAAPDAATGGSGPFVVRPAYGLLAPDPDRYALPFPGVVTAAGVPTELVAVPAEPASQLVWSVEPPDLGYFAAPGLFVGLREGEGRIVAARAASLPTAWQSAVRRRFAAGQEAADPLAPALQGPGNLPVMAASVPVRVIGRPTSLEVEMLPVPAQPPGRWQLRAWVRDEKGSRAPLDPTKVTFWSEGPVQARTEGRTLYLQAAAPSPDRAGAAYLQARYLHLQALLPLPGPGGPVEDPGAVAWPGPQAAPPRYQETGSGSAPAATPAPSGAAAAPSPAAGGAGPTVLLLAGQGAGSPAAAGSSWELWLAPFGRPPRDLKPGELALVWVNGQPPQGLGPAPNAGQARSARGPDGSRVLVVDPAARPWGWLARELEQAVQEGVRRLVVASPAPPGRWPLPREAELVQAWLASLTPAAEVVWVYPDPEAAEVRQQAVQGVLHLALPLAKGLSAAPALPGLGSEPATPAWRLVLGHGPARLEAVAMPLAGGGAGPAG